MDVSEFSPGGEEGLPVVRGEVGLAGVRGIPVRIGHERPAGWAGDLY